MRITAKFLAIPALALTLGAASLPALAQDAPPPPPPGHAISPAEMAKHREERITKIEQSLKLTPEQTPYWQKVADLMRSAPTPPLPPKPDEFKNTDISTIIAQRAQHMSDMAAFQSKLAETLKPLEASLNTEQKVTLKKAFLHMGPPHGPRHAPPKPKQD